MNARSSLVLILAAPLLRAADPTPAPVVDPPELAAARTAFETALGPVREKMKAAFAERAKTYATQLESMETQLAGAGKADSVAVVRAERDAYSSGRGTHGFDEEDKKVPTSARDLRRGYDRDAAKIRADHIPLARAAGTAFTRQLDDLERKYTGARNADGILAVRRQKQAIQGAANDPLAWGDDVVLGKWRESENFVFDLHADGRVTTSRAPKGKWHLEDRGKGRVHIKFEGWAVGATYELTPDGWGMNGKSGKGEIRTLNREK